MSKRPNNRFTIDQKNIDEPYRKCAHHVYSRNYVANVKQHHDIIAQAENSINVVDTDTPINITIVLHFLAPRGSYCRDRVLNRAHDMIMTLNDDFNNYSSNANTMNNFRYKSIVNQVFSSNTPKQNIYLGPKYLELLPICPSNITFQLGEIYYYPISKKLNLSTFDDVRDVEIQHQVMGQYMHDHGAGAILPECFLNIWVIDMIGTNIMGFSNFPWETPNDYHGIVINRRCFFPEDYKESNFCLFKTLTHQVGHYLGLLHVPNHNCGPTIQATTNINDDIDNDIDNSYIDPQQERKPLVAAYDPTDKNTNKFLHYEPDYNPLFMNFMDNTYDKYCVIFTNKQFKIMRYMTLTLRPKINSLIHKIKVPNPKYNPDTDTRIGIANSKLSKRNQTLIPPTEIIDANPRVMAGAPAMLYNQPGPNIPYHQQTQNITQLIPNLSSGNMSNTPQSSDNQIIANIQKNLPQYNTPLASTTPVTNHYDTMMKNFNSYNSADGYARSYPFDPYVMQQYNQNMGLIMEQNKLQQDTAPQSNNVVNMNPMDQRANNQTSQIPMQPTAQNVDPRFMQQMPQMQQMPPMPPMQQMPQTPYYDPRYLYQMDPRIYDPQYAAFQKYLKNNKKKSSKTKNRTDILPNNRPNTLSRTINSKLLEDQMIDSEINHEAVKNISRKNAYNKKPNNLKAVSQKKQTNIIEPDATIVMMQPNIQSNIQSNMQSINNLANRIGNIGNQLNEIKSKLPIGQPTGQPCPVPPRNSSVPPRNSSVPARNPTIPPRNRFIRNRPTTITGSTTSTGCK